MKKRQSENWAKLFHKWMRMAKKNPNIDKINLKTNKYYNINFTCKSSNDNISDMS